MATGIVLDLFCKAGGAAAGYARAGFDIVGMDIEPQPNYPHTFIQTDAVRAMNILAGRMTTEDPAERAYFESTRAMLSANLVLIHASPPCQKFTRAQALGKARNGKYPDTHPDYVEITRELLKEIGVPYVIENVVGAPLVNPTVLCGCSFPALRVYRQRLFETSFPVRPLPCRHQDSTPSAGQGVSPKGFISVCGSGGVRGLNSVEIVEYWRMAMGISWMDRKELAQAVPPAMTEYIASEFVRWQFWQRKGLPVPNGD